MSHTMDKLKDMLSSRSKNDNDYAQPSGATEGATSPTEATVKNSLAQGHLKDDTTSREVQISAPAELTGLTGQYRVGKDDSLVSDKERQKHGTANGLASATMASGAIGEQNPSQ
ncbi:hypothetical protein INS49_005307 [Diaporthe citri]|uniref:uncharacterized protein n=1 Tax=Diaporthe citri TaxID=83186 RepID=UPI001C7FD49D|nr:uncharacterized protein INS49_005307 [Diaporthe citri]KAG6353826.1 hypothetical protein INS49_005307 [Diaporthe citri]